MSTRIICTLGPATSEREVIKKLIGAGMNTARMNFSHGSHSQFLDWINIIRKLNSQGGRSVKILGDLQGHRIRVGRLSSEVKLREGESVWLTQQQRCESAGQIPFDYRGPLNSIQKGHQVFIDDGKICLEVLEVEKNRLKTKVVAGGLLKQHKGINIPRAKIDFGEINQKDKEDILFCREERIDFIAQSFVREAEDILQVRELFGQNFSPEVIAKIECREGIKNIDRIIEVSDGIMIARGDMGVSLPVYKVPVIQKEIIKKCNRAGKFVITATQMLESMTASRRPTRAEVSDVANAIIDGTDFVMLSGESSVGRYPVETVEMMKSIVDYTLGYLKKK